MKTHQGGRSACMGGSLVDYVTYRAMPRMLAAYQVIMAHVRLPVSCWLYAKSFRVLTYIYWSEND